MTIVVFALQDRLSMFTKTHFSSCIAILLSIGSAQAAPDVVIQNSTADITKQQLFVVKIETSMNINIPVAANSSVEDQVKTIEAGKKLLYQDAAKGCDALKQAFKGDCLLKNVRINSNTQYRGNMGDINSLNIGASYEVSYRPN